MSRSMEGSSAWRLESGNTAVKVAPWLAPGTCRGNRPLCASTNALLIASPRPRPPWRCPLALFKSIEDFRKRLIIDPATGVRYFNSQLARLRYCRAERQLSTFRSKLDGILDQVPKDLLEPGRVCLQMDALAASCKFEHELLLSRSPIGKSRAHCARSTWASTISRLSWTLPLLIRVRSSKSSINRASSSTLRRIICE